MNNFKGFGPYGFRPSEEELIGYLRIRTFQGPDYSVQDITDLGADICKWEPSELPGCSMVKSSDPVWYFTYPITYKHPNNNSKMISITTDEGLGRKRKPKPINRATASGGKWKVSGDRLKIKTASDSKEIGIKTRLYYCPSSANNESKKKGKAKGQNSGQNKTPWVLYEYELIDVEPGENKYFLGKLMLKQSEPTNISSSKEDQRLPSNYLENDHIPTPEVQLDSYQEPLVEMEVSHGYDWFQNQSSEQTNEFVNSFPAVNYETYPEERSNQENFLYDGNEVISNLKPPNFENYAADYTDIPQYLQVDHPFTNVFTDNGETYPEERSNKHNIVAENEGFSLPDSFSNYPVPDTSQINLFGFDDIYWDGVYLDELNGGLEAFDNNGDGVQNQSSVNQQAADELRNANLIDNEIAYPDERSKSAAAEIEGSNFPSLGMESSRKRSGMELEGSSIDTETEVAQAQAKKSRF